MASPYYVRVRELPIILSPTSLKTFRTCPQQWAFAYLDNIKAPPSVALKLGVAAHEAVEHNYTQKVETRADLPEDEVADAFSTAWDREIVEVEQPSEDPAKAKDAGVKLTRLYHKRVAPETQPLWVERSTQFRVVSSHGPGCELGGECSCGTVFNTTIDLVDEKRQVRDLKTTARRPSEGRHLMQVAAGAIGYEHETGEPAEDLVIDYLIRTKVPDHHQERWGGRVDAQMKRVFAAQVGAASTMIQQGLFPATGADAGPGGPCSWCGYGPKGVGICPVWKKSRA